MTLTLHYLNANTHVVLQLCDSMGHTIHCLIFQLLNSLSYKKDRFLLSSGSAVACSYSVASPHLHLPVHASPVRLDLL